MLELLRYVMSSPFVFIGVCILIVLLSFAAECVVRAFRK